MTALVRTLAAASGGEAPAPAGSAGDAAPVLDGPAIARSMSAAPGVVSVSLANTAAAAVEGPLRVSPIGDFLAAGGKGGFISFEQGGEGGRCTIAISRQTGPELLSLLSPEITDYLNALMAPLVTGETLSKPEYLALVSTVYGKAIADEISRSVIRASIEFPGPIRSVRGGAFSGRRANFDIPLPDLLVLETPLRYEAAWNQGSAD
jgi:hypothetical protein